MPKRTLTIMPDGLVKVRHVASGDTIVFDPDLTAASRATRDDRLRWSGWRHTQRVDG